MLFAESFNLLINANTTQILLKQDLHKGKHSGVLINVTCLCLGKRLPIYHKYFFAD